MKAVVKLLFIVSALLMISCAKKQIEQIIPYNGPLIEVDSVVTLYSDSAVLRVKLKAPKEFEYQNGNREFPKGVDIEFYNEHGVKSSTLVANTGYYNKEKEIYTVRGDVVIKSLLENKKMNTEELHWNPRIDKIYADTNVFVRIETPEEILTGKGLITNQQFTKYKILKPKGIFTVDEAP